MTKKPPKPVQNSVIKALTENGKSTRQIAKAVGMSQSGVVKRQKMIAQGKEPKHRPTHVLPAQEILEGLFEAGMTGRQIAELYGVSDATVSRAKNAPKASKKAAGQGRTLCGSCQAELSAGESHRGWCPRR